MEPGVAAFLIETGAETAERVSELLVEPLRKVYLVEMLPKIGEDIGKSTRWTMMLDLKRSQVQIHRRTKVLAIEETGVRVEGTDGEEALIECQNAVIAVGYRPNDQLAKSLEEAGLSVQVIGDAKAPRRAIDAIGEGFKAGWDL
jgi:2,4-dienoyl-CoA reductase (NADPH2)